MATLKQITEAVAQEEKVVTDVIKQKNGKPFLGPDGKPCTVSVKGSDSRQVRAVRDQIQEEQWEPGAQEKLTVPEWRARRIRLTAAAMTGWTGWTEDEEGKIAWAFTPENAKMFLDADGSNLILDQVEALVNRQAALFKESSAA